MFSGTDRIVGVSDELEDDDGPEELDEEGDADELPELREPSDADDREPIDPAEPEEELGIYGSSRIYTASAGTPS